MSGEVSERDGPEAPQPDPDVERRAASPEIASSEIPSPDLTSSKIASPEYASPPRGASSDTEREAGGEQETGGERETGDEPEAKDANGTPGDTGSPQASPPISGPGVLAIKEMGEEPPRDTCANCGTPLVGPYCSQCGQRAAERIVPLHEMTQEWVEDLFEFDLRIFRTLPTFFFKPGRLTKEYVQGRRVRYVRPLRLYLVSSFLLFSILAFSDFATIDAIESSPDDLAADSAGAASPTAFGARLQPSGDGRGEATDRATDYAQRVRAEFADLDSIENANPEAVDSIVQARIDRLRAPGAPGPAGEADTPAGSETNGETAQGTGESSGDERDSTTTAESGPVDGPDEDFTSVQRRREIARDVTKDISLNLSLFSGEAQKERAEQYVKDRIARTIIDPNAFIRGMIDRAPYVMFFLLPLFAFLLKLLYIRRKKLYVQHLIFALHIHAFIFFTFAIATGCLLSELPSLNIIGSWLTLAPFIYVYVAMQHVYDQGWVKTGIKLFILFTMYNTVLAFGVFFLAIASLLLM